MLGDFAPALVHFTDDVLFGEVWPRTELTPRERSLVTVASLTTSGTPPSWAATSAAPWTTVRRRMS